MTNRATQQQQNMRKRERKIQLIRICSGVLQSTCNTGETMFRDHLHTSH